MLGTERTSTRRKWPKQQQNGKRAKAKEGKAKIHEKNEKSICAKSSKSISHSIYSPIPEDSSTVIDRKRFVESIIAEYDKRQSECLRKRSDKSVQTEPGFECPRTRERLRSLTAKVRRLQRRNRHLEKRVMETHSSQALETAARRVLEDKGKFSKAQINHALGKRNGSSVYEDTEIINALRLRQGLKCKRSQVHFDNQFIYLLGPIAKRLIHISALQTWQPFQVLPPSESVPESWRSSEG